MKAHRIMIAINRVTIVELNLIIIMRKDNNVGEKTSLQSFLTVKQIKDIAFKIYKQSFQMKKITPSRVESDLNGHFYQNQSSCMEGYELSSAYLYFFAKNNTNSSVVTVYSFLKSTGIHNKSVLNQFNGHITCMKFQQKYKIQQDKQPQSDGFVLVVGFSDGIIKFANFEGYFQVRSLKLDVKPIKQIITYNYKHSGYLNICVVLTIDNMVYFVDISGNKILYILKPPLIMGDKALSIQFNFDSSFLLQCTQGGCVILWKMAKIIGYIKQKFKQAESKRRTEDLSLFPDLMTHTLSVQGLKSCSFYGNMLVLLKSNGILAIVSLIPSEQGQYVRLLQYKIQNYEDIVYMRCIPGIDEVVVLKFSSEVNRLERYRISESLQIFEIVILNLKKQMEYVDFYLTASNDIVLVRGGRNFMINLVSEIRRENVRRSQSHKQIIDY